MQKTSGWKIPLLFCATAGLVMAVVALWRLWSEPAVPPLDPGLLSQAKSLSIDLEADELGQGLKMRISNSSGGFGSHEQKDARLAQVAHDAAGLGRFDAACAASVLVYNDYRRDAILTSLAQRAAESCADLPWGAFAARGMRHTQARLDAHALLNTRWGECARDGTSR